MMTTAWTAVVVAAIATVHLRKCDRDIWLVDCAASVASVA